MKLSTLKKTYSLYLNDGPFVHRYESVSLHNLMMKQWLTPLSPTIFCLYWICIWM